MRRKQLANWWVFFPPLLIFELNWGNGDHDRILEERTGISRSLDTWERNARAGAVQSKRRVNRDELEMIPRRGGKVSVVLKTAVDVSACISGTGVVAGGCGCDLRADLGATFHRALPVSRKQGRNQPRF